MHAELKFETLIKSFAQKNLYIISLYSRKAAGAFTVFCLARFLSVSDYGLYAGYCNIAGILLLITNFGFNEYILVSSRSDTEKVKLKLSFFLLAADILMFIIVFCSFMFPLENRIIFTLVIIKFFLEGSFFSLILTYYQAASKFKTISIINFLYSIALFLCVSACYKFHLRLEHFLLMCIFSGLLNYAYSYKTAGLSFSSVIKNLKEYIRMIDRNLMYYGFVMVTVMLYFQLPSLFVSVFADKISAAIYFAAFNIFSIMLLISGAQVQQIMPEMIKADKTEVIKLIKNNIIYITAVNTAILLFFAAAGRQLLMLLYSKQEYLQAYPLLLIGAAGNIFMSAAGVTACFITAKGFQKKKLQYQLECLFIVPILLFIFRNLGITGAVWAYFLISVYIFVRYLIFTVLKIKGDYIA